MFGNENKSNDHTSNLSKMKNKTLPTCLQGNYRDSLGEFSTTPYGVFGAERVKSRNGIFALLGNWKSVLSVQ